ncbi:MAG: 2-C-methyl-D-erythritol 2,4-cyclodiphosphate synthase [candidate division Zixibacteria bacterium]|nr:2-C-methyl-D-erythritol 2,4-cyclodiphosphate synthase [candidate division Zixibacteria bacterium]
MSEFRIGQGFDVHPFAVGRKLIIGGVTIPYEKGLMGHSDADVLLHAIADAILGAAGLGDIGQYFPPSDPRFKDADSLVLLAQAFGKAKEAGCLRVINVDATILAERPPMNPHIGAMKDRIGEALNLSPDRVAIKATTTERLGFVGREEGIAALAVCLVSMHV